MLILLVVFFFQFFTFYQILITSPSRARNNEIERQRHSCQTPQPCTLFKQAVGVCWKGQTTFFSQSSLWSAWLELRTSPDSNSFEIREESRKKNLQNISTIQIVALRVWFDFMGNPHGSDCCAWCIGCFFPNWSLVDFSAQLPVNFPVPPKDGIIALWPSTNGSIADF